MEWTRNLDLNERPEVSDLADGVETLADGAQTTLDAIDAALTAAKVFLSGTAAPQAAAAQALVTDAQAIKDDLFGSGFFRIVIHPWVPGVGRREGVWRHLSFPQWVNALSASFDDLGDPNRPIFSSLAEVEMLAVVAGGPSPSIFQSTVEALLALIDTKELRLAARRIAQAFELDAARGTLPTGSTPPDWDGTITVREAIPALQPLEQSLDEHLAMLRGYADGAASAVDIATELVDAKLAQLTALQQRLAAARALFGQGIQGADVWKAHTQGTGGNAFLKSELADAAGAPGPELSFCAGVAWVGGAGSLLALRDLFGLS